MSAYLEAVLETEAEMQRESELERGIVRRPRRNPIPPFYTLVWRELMVLNGLRPTYDREVLISQTILAVAAQRATARVQRWDVALEIANADSDRRDYALMLRRMAFAKHGAPVSHQIMAGEGRGVP